MTHRGPAVLSPITNVFLMNENADEIVHGYLMQMREHLTTDRVSAIMRRAIIIGDAFLSVHIDEKRGRSPLADDRTALQGEDADQIIDVLTIIVHLAPREAAAFSGTPLDWPIVIGHLADYRYALVETRMIDGIKTRYGVDLRKRGPQSPYRVGE